MISTLLIAKSFTLTRGLCRWRADGTPKPLRMLSKGVVRVLFNGDYLSGPDIAWFLRYGAWPCAPVVQLGVDPFDFSAGNLFLVPGRRLRYCQTLRGGRFKHSLAPGWHSTPEACRAAWEALVREIYLKEAPRPAGVREQARVAPVLAKRSDAGARPAEIPGRVWHKLDGEWTSVPRSCHVGDDWAVRVMKVRAGAVRFALVKGLVVAFDQRNQPV